MTILSILPTARSTTLRNLQTWHYQWTWDDLVYIVVAQLLSCVQLCSPMDCSMPGVPVLHYLPEFAQTHNNPTILSSVAPFSACPQSFPASGSFPKSWLFASGVQSIEATASASVLSMNIQDWFPLGLTGLTLLSRGLSKVCFNTTVQKQQFFGAQPSFSKTILLIILWQYFRRPWLLRDKEFAYQCRRCGFNPWVEKFPWKRKW